MTLDRKAAARAGTENKGRPLCSVCVQRACVGEVVYSRSDEACPPNIRLAGGHRVRVIVGLSVPAVSRYVHYVVLPIDENLPELIHVIRSWSHTTDTDDGNVIIASSWGGHGTGNTCTSANGLQNEKKNKPIDHEFSRLFITICTYCNTYILTVNNYFELNR